MIHFNLTSHIVLNKVAENLYHPKTAVERSELTRFEKIHTDIFPKQKTLLPTSPMPSRERSKPKHKKASPAYWLSAPDRV